MLVWSEVSLHRGHSVGAFPRGGREWGGGVTAQTRGALWQIPLSLTLPGGWVQNAPAQPWGASPVVGGPPYTGTISACIARSRFQGTYGGNFHVNDALWPFLPTQTRDRLQIFSLKSSRPRLPGDSWAGALPDDGPILLILVITPNRRVPPLTSSALKACSPCGFCS